MPLAGGEGRRVKTEPVGADEQLQTDASLKWQCPECPCRFSCEYDLVRHYKPQHEGTLYTCEYCQQEFYWRADLKAHLQEHTGEYKYRCPQCFAGFTRLLLLRRHAASEHALMNVSRTECDVSINTKLADLSLQKEMGFDVDDKDTPNVNSEVGSKQETEGGADEGGGVADDNGTIKQGKIAQCPYCPRNYTNNWNVKRHIRFRHKFASNGQLLDDYMIPVEKVMQILKLRKYPRIADRIKCPRCPKKFTTLWNMKRHFLRRHEKRKPTWAKTAGGEDKENDSKSGAVGSKRKYVRRKRTASQDINDALEKVSELELSGAPEISGDERLLAGDERLLAGDERLLAGDERLLAGDERLLAAGELTAEEYKAEVKRRLDISTNAGKEAMRIVKCPDCPKTFTTVWNMKRHYGQRHDKNVFRTGANGRKSWQIKCPQCPKWFTTVFNMKRHFEPEHLGILYICDVCGVDFKTKQALAEHEKSVHTAVHLDPSQRLPCAHCHKTFLSVWHLRRHEQDMHSGSGDHICERCGKAFKYKSLLTGHLLSCGVTERLFICRVCGKRYMSLRRRALPLLLSACHACTSATQSLCKMCTCIWNKIHTRQYPFNRSTSILLINAES